MTPKEIQECYARANEVINGFKQPSQKNASDVIRLIAHFTYDPVKKPVENVKQNEYRNDIPDFFKDVFKGKL